MGQLVMVLRSWPRAPGTGRLSEPVPHRLTEHDIVCLQAWLQSVAGLGRIGFDVVKHGVEAWARERGYHPIRDWLEGLEASGGELLNGFLHKALGTEDSEYHRQVGRKFLIAMAARVLQPGCKADYMLVLEGPQGEEKSKFCRALAGDAYSSITCRRSSVTTCGCSAAPARQVADRDRRAGGHAARADPEGTKSFITRQVENYTPKRARVEVVEPRQCLFIGSTNDDDWIRDPTGGRRFWPVKVGAVDLAWLSQNRQQLFAQAVAAYRQGEPWWPDRELEKTVITPQQAERQFQDALIEPVARFVETKHTITMFEICDGLSHQIGKPELQTQRQIGNVLSRLGVEKVKTMGRIVWRNQS